MDFDSPDVAKEFPGLARALSSGVNEYDEWEKSKKKKEKKDSKKDKDKGYAALNDSPDEDEDETKSPGKSIKIKAFKLTSKKKDKDKKETASHKPKGADKERAKSLSSEVETKIMRDERQVVTASSSAIAQPVGRVADPTTLEGQPIQRRPFDGQGYKHSATVAPLKPSKHVKQDVPSGSNKSTADSATTSTTSPAEKKGLNVFLNAPVPLLLKKKDHKEKDAKKDPGLSSSKVKLKLKKGSKSFFEEGSSGTDNAHQNQNYQWTPHLPEDPEIIVKEIRKYETLLEQAHAQVKSSKKVSKKTEDQLWELQMTLTQLKRKLRSINALSASFPSPPPPAPPAVPKACLASVVSEPEVVPIIVDETSGKSSVEHPHSPQTTSKPNEPVALSLPAKNASDDKPTVGIQAPSEDSTKENAITKDPPAVAVGNSKISKEDVIRHAPSTEDVTHAPLPETLSDIELDRRDTIQVQVEVYVKDISQENPTPEDIYEQEITSFNDGEANVAGPLGKRENLEKSRRLLHIQGTPESSKSKSEEPPSTAGDESAERLGSEAADSEIDTEDGGYVFLKAPDTSQNSKPPVDSDKEDLIRAHAPTHRKVVTAPSIFDPFALPEFKTNEFIAVENDALILFTQQLQDEIVKEEEQIEELIRQIQEVSLESRNTRSDLEELDDDELVNLWQTVKFENDALNEQVLNLKIMVANSRLEEFRLETRVKYLQDRSLCHEIPAEPEIIAT